ncbi:hypothetical protein LTV02_29295 [Nocardia yamanashiensis]|uniref:DUF6779 domain-containing protein n=1 Tax=Nocardia yamanashiensis TaxID=209247 RepID=UPI001E394A00|nr:DUF6779 domain-containing protein [Nocardia yamanashiensis]UGT40104.1 hypothetical protein LTV02_29295 [Nocardia yamanashiensis]
MVSPSRSSTSRRRREDAGKFFTGVLLLLGLVASIFLVFSDNPHMIRVGLVAALWAAAIGALAATRYRREAAVDKAKVGDLQKVYQLQLEREVAARREYELGVETRVRREVGANAEEMAALRAELAILRENLHRLFDGDLLEERPALRAEAVRVAELPARDPATNGNSANNNWTETEPWDPWSTPDEDEQDLHARMAPVFDADHPEPPAFATPFDDPVTAETSIVTFDTGSFSAVRLSGFDDDEPADPTPAAPPVTPDRAFAPDLAATDATQSRPGAPKSADFRARTAEAPEPTRTEPLTGLEREQLTQVAWFETEIPAGNTPTDPVPTPAAAEPAASAANGHDHPASGPNPTHPSPSRASTPMGTASSRRRRRSEESTDSGPRLSVAEIMANLRSESER